MAIGKSASPKLSSSLPRSRTICPFIFPDAHDTGISFKGMPASASATPAAVRPAHLVPASAFRTSMFTSIAALGNFSNKITFAKASEMTFEISLLRLSGPGLFLSSTLKAAMLYLAFTMALKGF